MKTSLSYALLLLSIIFTLTSYGQGQDELIFSLEAPYSFDKNVEQEILYQVPQAFEARVVIRCFQIKKEDTGRLYEMMFDNVRFKQGAHSVSLNLTKCKKRGGVDNSFLEVVKRFDVLPPGVYLTTMSVFDKNYGIDIRKEFYWSVDSMLSYNSGLRNEINHIVAGVSPSKLSKEVAQDKYSHNRPHSQKQQDKNLDILHRKLRKTKGVSSVPESINGKSFVAIYFDKWFMGRYAISSDKQLKKDISKEFQTLDTDPSAFVTNNMEDFTSVSTQFKKLYKKERKENELKGMIDLNSYFSNGQEPGSEQDNNYEEINGIINTEIMHIPVEIEGFYTTQDRNRKAKASYIRVHYDVEKQKAEMSKLINGYKGKYEETATKGKGLEQIYQGYIGSLGTQKKNLLNGLRHDYGIEEQKLLENAGNVDNILSTSDDNEQVVKNADKLRKNKNDIQDKYNQITEFENKISKYKTLIEQYRNKVVLDSTINYSKIQKLTNSDDLSYKQMVKAASGILPKGKVANFVTGITNFDVGILNKYKSSYTLSGQSLKGLSVGYDLGLGQVGATIGSSEYVSRDGNVDRYTTYSADLNFKVANNHKTSIIYYGYTPSKKMFEDGFFSNIDVALPKFKEPVHIVSVTHEGIIGKYLQLEAEGAVSFRKSETGKGISQDNTAWKPAITYSIPKTTVSLKGEWEHLGANFENNVLPYNKSATDRYTIASAATLFRSFVGIGVQYNFLKQATFSSTGYSTRWGFDIKTMSKRWPNISVSYKPFSTFRAYNDTFSAQQQPMIGEVWIAKGTYQIRRKNISHRFTVLFNQNHSEIYTNRYTTKNLQLGYILISGLNNLNLSVGWMSLPSNAFNGSAEIESYYLTAYLNRSLSKKLAVTLGQDIGIAIFGLQRLSTLIGMSYKFDKPPLQLRIQGRYTSSKLTEVSKAYSLWAAQIGITWTFRTDIAAK